MTRRFLALMATTGMTTLPVAPAAWAQAGAAKPGAADAAAAEDAARNKDEIVVTGTLIRGVAPAGTEAITVTPQAIQESGAITTNDVLAKIPQVSFFNRTIGSGNDGGVGQNLKVNQPSVHGLPTLIMVDGHRIASAGGLSVAANSTDPSIIPTGVLGGIEALPDCGSGLRGPEPGG